ncbi:hypothetical protein [Streptomyces asiaticus]|uniref:hypothetical protein n=1 Tax=Streptomyces asiaticus TaxID=114695 RepID=UPI0038275CAE
MFGTEGSSANDVALLTAAQAHAKLPELFDGCGLPYVILPGSDSNPKAGPVFAKDRAPEYVLVTPQLAATKALQTSVESAWGCRSMALTEYSKTEAAPLGVPGDALGPCPATAGCALPGGRGGEPRREPEEVRRRRAVAAVLLVHQQERRPLRAGPGGAREGR